MIIDRDQYSPKAAALVNTHLLLHFQFFLIFLFALYSLTHNLFENIDAS